MILAIDPGVATFGWAVVHPTSCKVHALGALIQEHDPDLADTTSLARRTHVQAREVIALVNDHHVTTIAAEAPTFSGPGRIRMAQSLSLSWGSMIAIAAMTACELVEIPAKSWERAVMGTGTKVDYVQVFAALAEFIEGEPCDQLVAIPKRHRTHAVDAVGIGVYAALTPSATRIARRAS